MSLKGDALQPESNPHFWFVCCLIFVAFVNAKGEIIINWSIAFKFSETKNSSPPRWLNVAVLFALGLCVKVTGVLRARRQPDILLFWIWRVIEMIAELMQGDGRMFLARDEVPVEKKRESRKTRCKVVNGMRLWYRPCASSITSGFVNHIWVSTG